MVIDSVKLALDMLSKKIDKNKSKSILQKIIRHEAKINKDIIDLIQTKKVIELDKTGVIMLKKLSCDSINLFLATGISYEETLKSNFKDINAKNELNVDYSSKKKKLILKKKDTAQIYEFCMQKISVIKSISESYCETNEKFQINARVKHINEALNELIVKIDEIIANN
ncbi:MAG: hypothetical protein JXR90_00765 [Spirochaetes bacterium]|nr:hypothetical protein [Spirochaetota bacterium]